MTMHFGKEAKRLPLGGFTWEFSQVGPFFLGSNFYSPHRFFCHYLTRSPCCPVAISCFIHRYLSLRSVFVPNFLQHSRTSANRRLNDLVLTLSHCNQERLAPKKKIGKVCAIARVSLPSSTIYVKIHRIWPELAL